jgi:hypothetical protein
MNGLLRRFARRNDGKCVEPLRASWFETHGVAVLLTMRVRDLILRSIAKRCVSKDEATDLENNVMMRRNAQKTA